MCEMSWCDLDLTFDLAYLMPFYLFTGISDTILSLLYLFTKQHKAKHWYSVYKTEIIIM